MEILSHDHLFHPCNYVERKQVFLFRKFIAVAALSLIMLPVLAGQAFAQAKPRVLISTDIGGGDHDDAQSMIHAVLYANNLNYRGFVITRSDDEGVVRGVARDGVAMLRGIFAAYGRDLANLRSHDASYPSEATLNSLIVRGAFDSAWPGTLSAGARKIITEARASTAANPLYILTWGPIHDAAAALRSAPDIVPRVRLISIAGLAQDNAHPQAFNWLTSAVRSDSRYRNLWWIDSASTFRGMYTVSGMSGGASQRSHIPWIKANVDNHGSLGNLYFDSYTYNTSWRLSDATSPDGLKMGDSPSLLYLLDRAGNNDTPSAASWGGSYVRTATGLRTWSDKTDASLRVNGYNGARTVLQFRGQILASFAQRMDWARTRN